MPMPVLGPAAGGPWINGRRSPDTAGRHGMMLRRRVTLVRGEGDLAADVVRFGEGPWEQPWLPDRGQPGPPVALWILTAWSCASAVTG